MALFLSVVGVVSLASPAFAAVAPGDAATMAVDGAGTVHRSDSIADGQNIMRREAPRSETKVATDAGSILETSSATCSAVTDDRETCAAGVCTCSPGKVLWYHAGEKNYCVADGVRDNGEDSGVHLHYGSASDVHKENCDLYFNVKAANPPISATWTQDRMEVSSVSGDVRTRTACLNNVGWSADATHFGPEVLCGGATSSNPCPSTVSSSWMFTECQFSRDGTGMAEGMWCCSGDHHMCVLKCPSSDDETPLEVKCGMDHDTPQTTFLRGMDVCTAQGTKTCEMQSSSYASYRACVADEWWSLENSHVRFQSR